jgi:hypothetical protein
MIWVQWANDLNSVVDPDPDSVRLDLVLLDPDRYADPDSGVRKLTKITNKQEFQGFRKVPHLRLRRYVL